MTLEWKPPAKDGGAKVTGYRVERCEETSEEWVKVEDIKSYDTVYKVTGLKEGVGYLFSVSAKNQVGYGEPCETDTAVKPKKPEGEPLSTLASLFWFFLFVCMHVLGECMFLSVHEFSLPVIMLGLD